VLFALRSIDDVNEWRWPGLMKKIVGEGIGYDRADEISAASISGLANTLLVSVGILGYHVHTLVYTE
jgi:hypothetical protein